MRGRENEATTPSPQPLTRSPLLVPIQGGYGGVPQRIPYLGRGG